MKQDKSIDHKVFEIMVRHKHKRDQTCSLLKEKIAWELGVCSRTVLRAQRRLEKRELIKLVRKGVGRRRPNIFLVEYDELVEQYLLHKDMSEWPYYPAQPMPF